MGQLGFEHKSSELRVQVLVHYTITLIQDVCFKCEGEVDNHLYSQLRGSMFKYQLSHSSFLKYLNFTNKG